LFTYQAHEARVPRSKSYPIVQDREQADDVLQAALRRLATVLPEVHPSLTVGFFGFAAEQIRREVFELTRYHCRRTGVNQGYLPLFVLSSSAKLANGNWKSGRGCPLIRASQHRSIHLSTSWPMTSVTAKATPA
jgi:hypothetical protein